MSIKDRGIGHTWAWDRAYMALIGINEGIHDIHDTNGINDINITIGGQGGTELCSIE